MGEHFGADVAGDGHDRLIRGLGLGRFRYRVMPQIMEPQPCDWTPQAPRIGLAIRICASLSRTLEFAASGTLNRPGRLRQAVRKLVWLLALDFRYLFAYCREAFFC
jgi:hypothetical protein